MSTNIIGFMLIDTPFSALNNAGPEPGARTENLVAVKSIRKGKDIFPYISGQAVRYWWRDTLEQICKWKMSPIERTEKIAFTDANPFEYADDDIFGYMRAPKGAKGEAVTRLSPLKNSPLISVVPHKPIDDFGVMSRQKEGDPVPYEHQFYSTIMHGIFSLDIKNAGVFRQEYKSGYRNLTDKHVEKIKKSIEVSNALEKNDVWYLPKLTRVQRINDAISVLPFISGGAKNATHLTDVTPKILVLAILNCGNHIFMNLAQNLDGKASFNLKALEQVVSDYNVNFLTKLYIARREGFMDNLQDALESFGEKKIGSVETVYNLNGSFNQTVDAFVAEIEKHIAE